MMRALGELILIKVETSGVLKAGEGVWMKTEAGRIFRSIPGGKIHRWYKADSNGSTIYWFYNLLKILQMAAKMSREVAEACEKINWAGVEEVIVAVRPWIRVDGTLNRRVLDRLLGAALGIVMQV